VTCATNDLLDEMSLRVKNAEAAILDMPADGKELLKTLHEIRSSINNVKLDFNGDGSLARREFETKPSINDRVYGIIYSVWNNTSEVPETLKASFDIAEKQYKAVFPKVKDLDAKLENVEVQLNKYKAPYTPGRWPDKK